MNLSISSYWQSVFDILSLDLRFFASAHMIWVAHGTQDLSIILRTFDFSFQSKCIKKNQKKNWFFPIWFQQVNGLHQRSLLLFSMWSKRKYNVIYGMEHGRYSLVMYICVYLTNEKTNSVWWFQLISTRCCRWLYHTSMHVPSASTWAHKKGTNSNRTAWAIVLYLGTVFTGGNTQKPKN